MEIPQASKDSHVFFCWSDSWNNKKSEGTKGPPESSPVPSITWPTWPSRWWKKNSISMHIQLSGQIIMFHQPRFPWNKGISLTKPPFGENRSCEVAIICPELYGILETVRWFETSSMLKIDPTVSDAYIFFGGSHTSMQLSPCQACCLSKSMDGVNVTKDAYIFSLCLKNHTWCKLNTCLKRCFIMCT